MKTSVEQQDLELGDRWPSEAIFCQPGDRRYFSLIDTPVGEMLLVGDGESLLELRLPLFGPWDSLPDSYVQDGPGLGDIAKEIAAYFEGDLCSFSFGLAPSGTAFQLLVWRALCDIAYGATASYGQIAASVGRPKASRAVGMANHVNPIALIVPCHRVIGADGSLTGYGGGLDLKRSLLALESLVVEGGRPTWDVDSRQLRTS